MRAAEDRARVIAALQDLLDQLCAPDLTLPRAEALRAQLFGLLGDLDGDGGGAIADRGAGAAILTIPPDALGLARAC